MDAFAVRRVGKPHRGRFRRARTAVVAHVHPEPSGLRLLVARRKHRDRRVVRVQLQRCHRVVAQRLGQRLAKRLTFVDPPAHAGRIELHAVARGNLRLPVQRSVISVFRDEDVGQQARMGDAARDWQAGMGGCETWWPHEQTALRRIVRITLNAAATRASCSDTSSPSGCIALLHFGPVASASSTCSSRGRCGGSASFGDASPAGALALDWRARRTSATPRSPVSSSARFRVARPPGPTARTCVRTACA